MIVFHLTANFVKLVEALERNCIKNFKPFKASRTQFFRNVCIKLYNAQMDCNGTLKNANLYIDR